MPEIADARGNFFFLRTGQWAVDLIVKKRHEKELTNKFTRKLIKLWKEIHGATSSKERNNFLNSSNINKGLNSLFDLSKLNEYGEYDIETLFILMKLLAFQEKTNRRDAHVFFFDVLNAILENKANYQIISKAIFARK